MSKPNTKSLYAISDQATAGGNQGDNGLQRQAGELLTSPDCNKAFAGRMSTGGAEITDKEVQEAAFGGTDSLKALNLNRDQIKDAVDTNSNEDTFTRLAEVDADMAVDAAVKDTSLQTMALHGDNKMVAERTRVGITGFGNA